MSIGVHFALPSVLPQRCQEKQRTIGSLCKEMEQKQSLHDTRVGELLGNHSDAMARVAELEEKLGEGCGLSCNGTSPC